MTDGPYMGQPYRPAPGHEDAWNFEHDLDPNCQLLARMIRRLGGEESHLIAMSQAVEAIRANKALKDAIPEEGRVTRQAFTEHRDEHFRAAAGILSSLRALDRDLVAAYHTLEGIVVG